MHEVSGDLFQQQADALCLTTNGTVKKDGRAVMGAGVALTATKLWPEIQLLLGNQLKVFGNHVSTLKFDQERQVAVVNFPVKENWWEKARLDLIENSCKELVELATVQGWQKVIIPRPGCGNGGLTWDEVKPVLSRHFDDRFVVVHNENI